MTEKVKTEIPPRNLRLGSMLRVDFRRMLRSRLFYIIILFALILPIVMTVMTTMMDGMESKNQQTGEITVIEGPESTWQNIGTLPGAEAIGGMDVFALCNINMMFMAVAIFVCLFITDDFRSGYSKNLFTVRQKKIYYAASKMLTGAFCGALLLIAYFIGSLIGGAISGLSFAFVGFGIGNLILCMLSKIFLMPVFVSIFTLISVAAKKRAWLAICGSLGGGMLLFMTVSMITPLTATVMNLGLCILGGALFSIGIGMVCTGVVLSKTSLV